MSSECAALLAGNCYKLADTAEVTERSSSPEDWELTLCMGSVYVADKGNHSTQRFTAHGSFERLSQTIWMVLRCRPRFGWNRRRWSVCGYRERKVLMHMYVIPVLCSLSAVCFQCLLKNQCFELSSLISEFKSSIKSCRVSKCIAASKVHHWRQFIAKSLVLREMWISFPWSSSGCNRLFMKRASEYFTGLTEFPGYFRGLRCHTAFLRQLKHHRGTKLGRDAFISCTAEAVDDPWCRNIRGSNPLKRLFPVMNSASVPERKVAKWEVVKSSKNDHIISWRRKCTPFGAKQLNPHDHLLELFAERNSVTSYLWSNFGKSCTFLERKNKANILAFPSRFASTREACGRIPPGTAEINFHPGLHTCESLVKIRLNPLCLFWTERLWTSLDRMGNLPLFSSCWTISHQGKTRPSWFSVGIHKELWMHVVWALGYSSAIQVEIYCFSQSYNGLKQFKRALILSTMQPVTKHNSFVKDWLQNHLSACSVQLKEDCCRCWYSDLFWCKTSLYTWSDFTTLDNHIFPLLFVPKKMLIFTSSQNLTQSAQELIKKGTISPDYFRPSGLHANYCLENEMKDCRVPEFSGFCLHSSDSSRKASPG